jgi:ligand-binding sensor domain-containing protein
MRAIPIFLFLYRIIFTALILCCCAPLLGQAQAGLPLNLKTYPIQAANGFESRVVTGVVQDQSGFTWIGTSDGLYRYDGYGFRHYTHDHADTNSLADNNITRIAIGQDQKIWMGFNKGILCSYDPSSGRFTKYNLTTGKNKQSGGPVSFLYIDSRNRVWAGMRQQGFLELDIHTKQQRSYNLINENDPSFSSEMRNRYNTVNAAIEDDKGNMWLATHNGLYYFNVAKHSLIHFPEHDDELQKFRNDNYISIEQDGYQLWLGSWGGGLARYHIAKGIWKRYKMNIVEPEKFTTNIVSSIRKKSTGELWITSNDKGLGVFDIQKEKFLFYSGEAAEHIGLPANLCYGIYINRNGSLWLTHEWGLTRLEIPVQLFAYKPVPVSKTDNIEYYYIKDVAEDERYRYIATEFADGLHVEDKKTGTVKTFKVAVLPGEEPFQVIHRIYIDNKKRVWVISRDIIYEFNKTKQQLETVVQPPVYSIQNRSNEFNDCVEDTRGRLWISSGRNGVFCYDPEQKTYRHYTHMPGKDQGLASNTIAAVAVDGTGKVWVGGSNACLAYFNEKKNRFENFSVGGQNSKGSTVNHVNALYADKKNILWAGTDAGLLKINTNKLEKGSVGLYNAIHGIKGTVVNDITVDQRGLIWVTTNSALCVVNDSNGSIKSYALQKDILKSISGKLKLTTSFNKVRILTYGGYYETEGLPGTEQDRSYPVKITSFRVGDKEYYFDEQLKKDGRIRLHPGEQMFSFEFGIPERKTGSPERYEFMLEGFDADWVHADGRRYASYTNIRSGHYTFRVRNIAANTTDVSSIAIPIRVVAPFYLRWWFLLLIGIVVVYLSYEWYAYRLRKQAQILKLQARTEALEKEKTLVQYENLKQHLNPHFLFNSLTSLGSLIRLDQKMAASFLDGMSKIYRYILQSKDAETVLLKDEINFVQTFIRLQETRFGKGLEIQIDIDPDYMFRKIVPVTLQNLIENAIKHNIVDEDTPLVVEVLVEDEYLMIRNNLQRKSFVETSNRQGLENLISLYAYLTERKLYFIETTTHFTVKIPLI